LLDKFELNNFPHEPSPISSLPSSPSYQAVDSFSKDPAASLLKYDDDLIQPKKSVKRNESSNTLVVPPWADYSFNSFMGVLPELATEPPVCESRQTSEMGRKIFQDSLMRVGSKDWTLIPTFNTSNIEERNPFPASYP